MEVMGREKEMRTSRRGEFWRLLLPGAFTMRAWHRDKYGYMVSDIVCVEVRVRTSYPRRIRKRANLYLAMKLKG